MATQYDPIAKDGSLNTTEATPRNIADVLAEGLKGIEEALPPNYTEGDGIDISNNEISVDTAFTEASTRANIASGDSFSTILGKIKKFFTDLKTVAFTGAYSDLNGTENVAVKDANNNFSAGQVVDAGIASTSTTSVVTRLELGNNKAEGTQGCSQGILSIYDDATSRGNIYAQHLTHSRSYALPDKDGTIALTSDVEGDTDVYVGADTFNITLKRTPALIMFRPSGNDVRVLISVTGAGKAYVMFDYNNLNTVTVNNCTGNVVNVTTTQFCGYAVIY